MAGIYIHIPFCRKKCHYCDFYKTTKVQKKKQFLEALFKEITLRAEFLRDEEVETIYLGGGTPSVLTHEEVKLVLQQIKQQFPVKNEAEITLEANPDDLSLNYLKQIKGAGINRLSIGIQSFSDPDLKLMNRRHSAVGAIQSIENALQAGFSDISIDLIYGIPDQTLEQWKKNLNISVHLPINHISAYHLTFHEGTPFYKRIDKGIIKEMPEELSIAQFEELLRATAEAGFEQYEISNFARNKAYSKHNTSYWQGKKYLGLGPAAHSYDHLTRQWNKSDLDGYISSAQSGEVLCSNEVLSEKDKLNDYIITGIRTVWGISVNHITTTYGEKMAEKVIHSAHTFLDRALIKMINGVITLTPGGMMLSDQITLALVLD
jgi:oxygen-independent coproporphyrinogen III oxidase